MILAARVIGICILLLSSLPTGALTIYVYLTTSRFVERAQKTTATVVGFEESQSNGTTMYRPIFSFVDKDGQTRRAASIASHSPRPYDEGQQVSSLYDLAGPMRAEPDTFWSLWLGTILCGGFAVLSLLSGLGFLFVSPIVIRAIMRDVSSLRRGEPVG